MNLIGNIAHLIIQENQLKEMIEGIISYHVLPEMQSSEPFLRMRAIWLYGEFQYLGFADQTHIHQVMDSMYKCLYDQELPVKVYAATTIYKLLKNSEAAQTFLRPGLKDILQVYLKLLSEIESDELVTALEKIVSFYKEDIEPFALLLSSQLVDSYQRLIQVNAIDDGGDSAMASMGCVTALGRIIRSCKSNKEILAKLEKIVYPVIVHSFTLEGDGTLEEASDCLSLLLYYGGRNNLHGPAVS